MIIDSQNIIVCPPFSHSASDLSDIIISLDIIQNIILSLFLNLNLYLNLILFLFLILYRYCNVTVMLQFLHSKTLRSKIMLFSFLAFIFCNFLVTNSTTTCKHSFWHLLLPTIFFTQFKH